jgi:hypothetical protein
MLLLLVVAAPAAAANDVGRAASIEADARIEQLVDAAAVHLDPRAAAALERIDALGPRLLALRSYLRAGASLDPRWSWTDEEIAQYGGSALQQALDAEIARVRAEFESANPGYTLWANPQVRSLDLQLQRWNENTTVAAAGEAMLAAARAAMTAAMAPERADRPAPPGRGVFEAWLAGYVPEPTPPLAAPGLSAHGRMSAVDFQVWRDEQVVAGTSVGDVEAVWNAGGWRERLQRAVRESSQQFHGPLAVPDEPWHYDYRPEAGVLAAQ